MSTLDQISEIIRDVLDEDGLVVTRETTAKDGEDWDSLAQVQIISAIETEFKFRFTTEELGQMMLAGNVGGTVDLIDAKLLQ